MDAFAAEGDPPWPACTELDRTIRLYDAESTVKRFPHERSQQLWAAHSFAPLGLASADS